MREQLLKIEQHPLSELWLVRSSVRAPHIDHFKSVMDCVDPEEASRLAYEAGKRFDGDYIEERRTIEAWLRAEARAKGIDTSDAPPLYFRLHPRQTITPHESRLIINIPADVVPADVITFTIEDSFHNYAQLQGRPYRDLGLEPRVLTAHELASELTDAFPEHLDGRISDRYIEGQLWRRDIPALRVGHQAIAGASANDGIITIT